MNELKNLFTNYSNKIHEDKINRESYEHKRIEDFAIESLKQLVPSADISAIKMEFHEYDEEGRYYPHILFGIKGKI